MIRGPMDLLKTGSEVGLINLSLKETLSMDYGVVDNVTWSMNDNILCGVLGSTVASQQKWFVGRIPSWDGTFL